MEKIGVVVTPAAYVKRKRLCTSYAYALHLTSSDLSRKLRDYLNEGSAHSQPLENVFKGEGETCEHYVGNFRDSAMGLKNRLSG